MLENAFDEVSLDFCGPFPDEKYLLVLIDEHSRFHMVEILTSINAKSNTCLRQDILSISNT